jgi:hypothetical protein
MLVSTGIAEAKKLARVEEIEGGTDGNKDLARKIQKKIKHKIKGRENHSNNYQIKIWGRMINRS